MRRLLFVALLFCPLAVAAQPTPVRAGSALARDLPAGARHVFTLDAPARSFVAGAAVQHDVDVVVEVFTPSGRRLERFDGPARGPEPFAFTADTAGVYRVEVTPFAGNHGRYTFELTRAEPVATDPAARVDQLFHARDRRDTPGIAVAVVQGDRVLLRRVYGQANLTHGVPVGPETPFNVGSVTKQFTAFAIALLAEQGRLSLDDDVRRHLPELPDFGRTITLRHLLTHTSGLREIINLKLMAGWRGGDYLAPDAAIQVVQHQKALQNVPGAEFNYNNTGYMLLASVIARVGGQPYPAWMQANVFAPLGMAHTRVRASPGEIVPGAATGYAAGPQGTFREVTDLSNATGAGGIYAPLDDLARWLDNLEDGRVGGAHVRELMRTRAVTPAGDTLAYGLGLFVDRFRGLRRIQHAGNDAGHAAYVMLLPERDVRVVVLSNEAGYPVQARANEIATAYFGDLFPPETAPSAATQAGAVAFDPARFDALAGDYELQPGFTLSFTREGGRFYTQATGQQRFEIFPSSDTTFFLTVVPASVTFHRAAGEPQAGRITLHQGGQNAVARRGGVWRPTTEELAAFAGRYYSEELEAFYTVAVREEALAMMNRRYGEWVRLRPSGRDVFGSGVVPEVRFERGADGGVSTMVLSHGRTRGVRFERVR